jgi:putative peptidoglycan lipid II flippase
LNDDAGVRGAVSSGLRMMLMVNVPATAGLVALAVPIVTLIYEHGRFSHADTVATAGALMFYAPGLVGYSAVKLISPAFYALGNSRIPVMASAASVVVNISLNLILVRMLGHRGLALGTAIAALTNAVILLWLLRKRLGGIDGGRLLTALTKITLASVVMAGAAYEAERWLHVPFAGDALVTQAVRVFGAITIGLVVLGICVQFLRMREFTESLRTVVRSR